MNHNENMDFDELQELKASYRVLAEQLKDQKIINSEYLSRSMRHELSTVETNFRFNVIGLSLLPVLGILLGLLVNFPGWFFAVYYGLWICLVVSTVVLYRRLRFRELLSCSFVEASRRVESYKRCYMLREVVGAPFAVALLLAMIYYEGGQVWTSGRACFILAGGLLGGIWGLMRLRREYKALNEICRQIRELQEE